MQAITKDIIPNISRNANTFIPNEGWKIKIEPNLLKEKLFARQKESR
jgi:hypothetical protein